MRTQKSVFQLLTLILFPLISTQLLAQRGFEINNPVVMSSPAPACEHRPESSQESFVERATGGRSLLEAAFGNEAQCLRDKGLLRGGDLSERNFTSSDDLNNFFDQCTFQKVGEFSDIERITYSIHLQNRDRLVNGLWQDLANRSQRQFGCRVDTLKLYRENPGSKQSLDTRAQAKFAEVVDRVRELILSKKRSKRRNQADTFKRFDCTGLAWIFCNDVSNERTEIDIDRHEAAIATEIAKIPFGYEPDVAEALFTMAESGKFDPDRYQAALQTTEQRYYTLTKYYEDRVKSGSYCIDDEFKKKAVTTGVAQMLIGSYSDRIMSPSQRALIQCNIESKYKTTDENLDQTANVAFMVGGAATAVMTAIPSGGGSVAAFGAVASAGLSAASFAYQVRRSHDACFKKEFAISAEGAESCNPEQDFQNEVNQPNLSECLQEIGIGALDAIFIPLDIKALVRARRTVHVNSLVEDAASAAEVEALRSGRAVDAATPTGRAVAGDADEVGEETTIVVTAPRAPRAASAESVSRDPNEIIQLVVGRSPTVQDREATLDILTGRLRTPADRAAYFEQRGVDFQRRFEQLESQINNRPDVAGLRRSVNEYTSLRVARGNTEAEAEALDLAQNGAKRGDDVSCDDLNRFYPGSFPSSTSGSKCMTIDFEKDVKGMYCACGARSKNQFTFLSRCPGNVNQFRNVSSYVDDFALPSTSLPEMCSRVDIPKGKRCYLGSTATAFAGFGGAAQLMCMDKVSGRWDEATRELISTGRFSAGEPAIIPSRWAPFTNFPELQSLVERASRTCPQRCSPDQLAQLKKDYETALTGIRSRVSDPEDLRRLQSEESVFVEYFGDLQDGRRPFPTADRNSIATVPLDRSGVTLPETSLTHIQNHILDEQGELILTRLVSERDPSLLARSPLRPEKETTLFSRSGSAQETMTRVVASLRRGERVKSIESQDTIHEVYQVADGDNIFRVVVCSAPRCDYPEEGITLSQGEVRTMFPVCGPDISSLRRLSSIEKILKNDGALTMASFFKPQKCKPSQLIP